MANYDANLIFGCEMSWSYSLAFTCQSKLVFVKCDDHTKPTLRAFNGVIITLVLMPWLFYKLLSDSDFPWRILVFTCQC